MKKLLLTLVAIFAISSLASAQFYGGGSIGFGTMSENEKAADGTETDLGSTTSFNLSPRVGYTFDEKWSFGATLDIIYLKEPGRNVEWISTTTFGLTPYARYKFLSFGKFAIIAEGGIGFLSGSTDHKDKPSNTKISSFTFDIYARPILTYDITKKISLEMALNFCNIGFSTTTNSIKVDNDKDTSTSTFFDIGVNTNDAWSIDAARILNGESIINIGFIYRF